MKQLFVVLFFVTIGMFSQENKMKSDVTFLADDKLEGRNTGSVGERLAADYIVQRFEEMGYAPKGTDGYFQSFTFKPKAHPHAKVEFTDSVAATTITGKNIVAFLDNGAENTIIIGAHYDHLGWGEQGSLYRGEKAIHNGADDNASGVAVMLNLAVELKNSNTNNNYLFMAFSGEEMGLLGSNYFVKHTTIDLSKVNYMINMDMVGRLKEDKTLAVYGIGTSPIFKEVVEENAKGKFHLILKESGVGPSDHTSFYLADLPVLHLFTGQHADYHKPSDDSDLLNYEGMQEISDFVIDIVSDLNDDGKLAFTKTKNEQQKGSKFKVTLGVIPDYLFDGKGMRIDGVTDGKPAQKAGIIKGDIVIKMGDIEVAEMMDYVKALGKFEKGQSTKVIVRRDGKEVELEVTF
ncbi:MAG: peptidase M28 [Flavobacteriaceae bacterium]|nr:MAG: peptidase M28 [Flavobacteriaceae bacterium]